MRASLKLRTKLLARSRGLAFVRDALGACDPRPRALQWRRLRLHYRPGSSDPWMLYEHLMKPPARAQCAPPAEAADPGSVRTVLDIGANIGSTGLHFARPFPNARVFAFGPVPESFALLDRLGRRFDIGVRRKPGSRLFNFRAPPKRLP